MNIILSYLSFIPYFIYLYLLIKEELLNEIKGKNIFRFDTLILALVFYYFANYKVDFVSEILFFTINLYLLANKLYDKSINQKLNFKKEFFKILIVYLIALILLLPFIFGHQLNLSYYLSFILILIIHFIIWLIKKIF